MTDSGSTDTLAGLALERREDAGALARALAARVADALRTALEARASASLVVSGGTTPAPMFDALARESLDWSRVGVTLADERAVPVDDPASNEAMVRERLLTGEAARAGFAPLYTADGDLVRAAAGVDALARPFDVVLLGMGTDGHTASLFPDAPELERAMNDGGTLLEMHPPSADQTRITLTRASLADARETILHVTGEAKREVLERAMAEHRERGDAPGVAPIARTLARALERGGSVAVWWAP